jgi:small GTP-binding protein
MSKNVTIGILAHVDAGKTTLSEGFLYMSGAIRNLGRVDHRDTFLDTYELEKSRGITIFSKQAIFEYEGVHYTLLDTPGHADFSPEMERTLQVLDAAVLIISAPDRVTSQAKVLFGLLEHYKVPTFIFVNKMDQADAQGSSKEDILASIKVELSQHVVDFSLPVTDAVTQENLAVCDDDLLAGFLDGKAVDKDSICELISSRKCFPCRFGSALKMEGVKELMDLLTEYVPEMSFAKAASDGAPFGARVFKISRDDSGARLTHIKIVSGTLKVRDQIDDEKIDQIRLYSGEKYTAVKEAGTGMICAVTGLTGTRAGEGIGSLKGETVSEVLQPILSSTLILPDEADPIQVYGKLRTLEEEEPMLLLNYVETTRSIEVQTMGEVQKEILKHLIKTRFDLDVSFGPGHVVYKETIAGPVEGVGHYEPLRHYAEVHLLLEPGEPGSGVVFDNRCNSDELAVNWQRLIMTHLGEKKHLGVLTGSEITDIKITILTGRAHEKHTEGGDFRQATYRAVRQGLMEADSILLEPVFDYRIELPQEFVGRAMGDMQRLNGTVAAPDTRDGTGVITGTVPATCLGDYSVELASYTKGQGKLFTTLSGYAPCHNAEEIIAAKNYDPELDVDNSPDSVFCMHGAGTVIPWNEVKSRMHLEAAWTLDGTRTKTDLSDSIDMEALSKLQARLRKQGDAEMSFDEAQRKIRLEDAELERIFERTYGAVKPRYAETTTQITAMTPEEKEARRDLEVEKSKREKYENQKGQNPEEYREYLLVDGYNIIYASKELSNLAATDLKAARDALVDILHNFQGFRREKVLLVFDAYRVPGGKEHVEEKGGLVIIYTKEAETADQYIEKAAHEISKKYRVTVATSDAIEQVIVMGSGAIRLSARDFWLEVERTGDLIREKLSE